MDSSITDQIKILISCYTSTQIIVQVNHLRTSRRCKWLKMQIIVQVRNFHILLRLEALERELLSKSKFASCSGYECSSTRIIVRGENLHTQATNARNGKLLSKSRIRTLLRPHKCSRIQNFGTLLTLRGLHNVDYCPNRVFAHLSRAASA